MVYKYTIQKTKYLASRTPLNAGGGNLGVPERFVVPVPLATPTRRVTHVKIPVIWHKR